MIKIYACKDKRGIKKVKIVRGDGKSKTWVVETKTYGANSGAIVFVHVTIERELRGMRKYPRKGECVDLKMSLDEWERFIWAYKKREMTQYLIGVLKEMDEFVRG